MNGIDMFIHKSLIISNVIIKFVSLIYFIKAIHF